MVAQTYSSAKIETRRDISSPSVGGSEDAAAGFMQQPQ